MSHRASRTDRPHGSSLWRVDGRPVAGVGLDADGHWTWWSRSTQGRRVVADTRDEAIRQAQAAVEREVA